MGVSHISNRQTSSKQSHKANMSSIFATPTTAVKTRFTKQGLGRFLCLPKKVPRVSSPATSAKGLSPLTSHSSKMATATSVASSVTHCGKRSSTRNNQSRLLARRFSYLWITHVWFRTHCCSLAHALHLYRITVFLTGFLFRSSKEIILCPLGHTPLNSNVGTE